MILICGIPQLDIPDVGRNHILSFFFSPVCKIISVQEIYTACFGRYYDPPPHPQIDWVKSKRAINM